MTSECAARPSSPHQRTRGPWSPDRRWLSGYTVTLAGGPAGNALYDLTAGTVRELTDDAVGEQLAWMPDHPRVVYFTATGNIVVSPDGRTIYYGAQQITQ